MEGFGLFLANLVTNVLFHVNHNFGKSGNKCLEMLLKNETGTNLHHGITKTRYGFLQKYCDRVCILQVIILGN